MSATAETVLDDERAHLELARRCLVAMRAEADSIADFGVDALASEALGRLRAQRLRWLDADPDAPAFFGRIDMGPGAARDARGPETFHVGRRHLRDEDGDPVVLDWRAPLAQAFYRATAEDPMGLVLRRRFGFRNGALTSYEDEALDRGEYLGVGSGLLRAEIERPRVGPMRDIVATIQPDQDELVRADLDTSLCIQGAPGTGKTAVGLHRAAFLLYTYPQRLRRTGVLVIGPNQAFLHYIGQVLPSLGEGGIEQTTVAALVGASAEPAAEPLETAILKGDPRMAEVLRRALVSQVRKPAEDVVAVVGTKRYRIGTRELRRIVDDARRGLADGLRWSTARERIATQVAERVRRMREDAGGAPSDAETARVARSAPVREFVDAVWPALTAEALLSRLYAEPEFLAAAAGSRLTETERALLTRPAARTLARTRWSAADAVLLDELRALIAGCDSYVHVVLDEAQDLSAMQCRAVGRRCGLGSMTVLGDLAQATTPWAMRDWTLILDAIGRPARTRALTAGFRVPATVLELANRLLPRIADGVPPATSIRPGRDAVRYLGEDDLAAVIGASAEGSVGVIVPDARADDLLADLSGLGVRRIADDADVRLTLVPASAAKGLEFDTVVLVDPAGIVAAERDRADGLRRLYVALTRAVSQLVVLSDAPLPAELVEAG